MKGKHEKGVGVAREEVWKEGIAGIDMHDGRGAPWRSHAGRIGGTGVGALSVCTLQQEIAGEVTGFRNHFSERLTAAEGADSVLLLSLAAAHEMALAVILPLLLLLWAEVKYYVGEAFRRLPVPVAAGVWPGPRDGTVDDEMRDSGPCPELLWKGAEEKAPAGPGADGKDPGWHHPRYHRVIPTIRPPTSVFKQPPNVVLAPPQHAPRRGWNHAFQHPVKGMEKCSEDSCHNPPATKPTPTHPFSSGRYLPTAGADTHRICARRGSGSHHEAAVTLQTEAQSLSQNLTLLPHGVVQCASNASHLGIVFKPILQWLDIAYLELISHSFSLEISIITKPPTVKRLSKNASV
ncbi:hypothetical protein F7725_008084 [Dissostichus mawsoni]|uniref:Uncharacterized protein n=1 Tax=Dissostichus mawsoni TaxID=36200 RepID=A0A7J5Y7A1_DISMA|nr:hypothetical protein F7725_008084 [Dissostichus mawsoni]